MEVYTINNLDGYAHEMRQLAACHINENYSNENLDTYISLNETKSLIIENCNGYDDENNLILDKDGHESAFDSICNWIFGIGLVKLASDNQIDCAWDSEENRMVFSVPNSENKYE
jgi:hypothetical protein